MTPAMVCLGASWIKGLTAVFSQQCIIFLYLQLYLQLDVHESVRDRCIASGDFVIIPLLLFAMASAFAISAHTVRVIGIFNG